ncbi:MAG: cupin domain-containing protein [Caldilineaceae bacterium]
MQLTETPTTMDFAKVLAPVTVEDFLLDYWEQQPLVVRRDAPTYYHDLLTMADVDYALTNMALRFPDFRVIKYDENIEPESYIKTVESRMEPITDVIDIDQVMNLYGEGATIILHAMQRYWQPLAAFCAGLSKSFSAHTKANVYLTPPHTQGYTTHWDNHDVMVLQLAGRKQWRIYGSPEELPDEEERYFTDKQLGAPLYDLVLEAGDFIYIPRGFIHEAFTEDDTSLHITVTLDYLQWRHLLQELLAISDRERLLREALPAGFAATEDLPAEAEIHFDRLLAIMQQKLPQAFANLAEAFVSSRQPFRDRGLLDMNNVEQIDLATIVQVRPNAFWRLKVDAETATLVTTANKQLSLPAFTEDSLRFALTATPFAVGDLAGPLDDGSKLVLVKRLIREGLLQIHELPAATADHTGFRALFA